jgi:hypothetical protein
LGAFFGHVAGILSDLAGDRIVLVPCSRVYRASLPGVRPGLAHLALPALIVIAYACFFIAEALQKRPGLAAPA